MPGSPVQIGPFLGGLNTYSDETSVADNQLVVCDNFELDLDGSLVSRPPIVDRGVTFPLGATGNLTLLGYYIATGNVPYLLASDGLSSTYYFNGTSWLLITDTVAATSFAQFNGLAYLVAPIASANPGGSWSPTAGFTAEPNMPKGNCIVSYRFRLWIAQGKNAATNATRLYFSNVLGNPSGFWPTTANFVDIGSGDGQAIVQLAVYFNTLLIFRTNSIYNYSYTSDPASGAVSQVVQGVGLQDDNCLVAFESYLYFMHNDKAYEFINNRASQVNPTVPFEEGSHGTIYVPYAVSVFNKRIIFSFYSRIYVFNLNTRTWTTWSSTAWGAVGKFFEQPGSATSHALAITHSSNAVPTGGTRTQKTLFITDDVTDEKESFVCTMQTKNYSYEASSVYKRLFWWGMEAKFRGTVTAQVIPITLNFGVTWGQLYSAGKTWGQLLSNTWGHPLSGSIAVVDSESMAGSGAVRVFTKFPKSLRFRQVAYSLAFDTNGSTDNAPVRLFQLQTYVAAKETVVKKNS